MSIDSLIGVEPGDLYTTDGKDAWEVKTQCERPTITLRNIRTGEERGGAVGCPNLENFKPLKYLSEDVQEILTKAKLGEEYKAVADLRFLKYMILRQHFIQPIVFPLSFGYFKNSDSDETVGVRIEKMSALISFLEGSGMQALKALWFETTGKEWKEE